MHFGVIIISRRSLRGSRRAAARPRRGSERGRSRMARSELGGALSGVVAARARRGRTGTSAHALRWPVEARGALWHHQQQRTEPVRLASVGGTAASRRRATVPKNGEYGAAGAQSGAAAARARRGRAITSAHALRRPVEARDALWCSHHQQTEPSRLSSSGGAAAMRRRAAALEDGEKRAAGVQGGAAAVRARRGRGSTSAHALRWPGEAQDALWHHHRQQTEPLRLSSGGGTAASRRRAAALENGEK